MCPRRKQLVSLSLQGHHRNLRTRPSVRGFRISECKCRGTVPLVIGRLPLLSASVLSVRDKQGRHGQRGQWRMTNCIPREGGLFVSRSVAAPQLHCPVPIIISGRRLQGTSGRLSSSRDQVLIQQKSSPSQSTQCRPSSDSQQPCSGRQPDILSLILCPPVLAGSADSTTGVAGNS